jgi:hypothetical protein
MLCMVEKVALAALVGRMPIYNVEIWVCCEWWRGGNVGIGVVEQAIHVAWEASGRWWTGRVRDGRARAGAVQRVDGRRVVGGIGRRSVSRGSARTSDGARRVVVAIRIVIAVHGGRVR